MQFAQNEKQKKASHLLEMQKRIVRIVRIDMISLFLIYAQD